MAERPASSPGDFRSSASQTDARPRVEAILSLERLLDILFPGPPSLDCVTIDDIERRYPLTGLGAPALRAIEQSQRIVRARGEFSQAGTAPRPTSSPWPASRGRWPATTRPTV